MNRALGEKLAKYPLLFAKAAFFGRRPSRRHPSRINNGTISLVNLGERPFAVTCHHVIDAYRQEKEKHDDVIFQIGDLDFDPVDQLIDENKQIDMATIDLTEEQLRQITSQGEIGSQVFHAREWPPERVLVVGDSVLFGGFPGKMREVVSFDEYVFESWSSGGSLVSSISEYRFVSAFEREHWVRDFGSPDHLELDKLGGMSGGPAFVDRGLCFDFVGIIIEHSDAYDAMFFSSANSLNSDGTLNHPIIVHNDTEGAETIK